MMNSNEFKKFPVTFATGGTTTSEKAEVIGAKAKAATTTAGSIIGAILLSPVNGIISFVTDICALGADVVNGIKEGKGGD